jgi:hypothetical protein
MDYISGVCFRTCWVNLGWGSRSSITSQVAAEMIQEMESVTLEMPSLTGGGNRFRGVRFTYYGAGPFDTLQTLEDWFNHKLEICEKYRQATGGTPKFKFQRLVLTYQDIAPRNLILDKSGQVWLVD